MKKTFIKLTMALLMMPSVVGAQEIVEEYPFSQWYANRGETSYTSALSSEAIITTNNKTVYLETATFCGQSLNNRFAFEAGMTLEAYKGFKVKAKRMLVSVQDMKEGDKILLTTSMQPFYVRSGNVSYIDENGVKQIISEIPSAGKEADAVPSQEISKDIEYAITSGNTFDFYCTSSSEARIESITIKPSQPLTIGSTGYATFCSKADLDISGFAEKFKAYYVSYVNGSNVVMTEITDVIPAGAGVIVKGDAGTYNLPQKLTDDNDIANNMLQAVTEATTVPSTTEGYQNYVLINRNGEAGFYKVEEAGRTFSAGKAYLKVPVESASKQMLGIAFDNEATGISSVEKNVMHNDVYYNLNGQRVEKPTKGMYIINNKKVVVK